MCCNVLQCVAVSCSVLQRDAAKYIPWNTHRVSGAAVCVGVCCSVLQYAAVCGTSCSRVASLGFVA